MSRHSADATLQRPLRGGRGRNRARVERSVTQSRPEEPSGPCVEHDRAAADPSIALEGLNAHPAAAAIETVQSTARPVRAVVAQSRPLMAKVTSTIPAAPPFALPRGFAQISIPDGIPRCATCNGQPAGTFHDGSPRFACRHDPIRG